MNTSPEETALRLYSLKKIHIQTNVKRHSVPHVDDDDDGLPQPHSPLHETRRLDGGLAQTLLRAPLDLRVGAPDGFDDGDDNRLSHSALA